MMCLWDQLRNLVCKRATSGKNESSEMPDLSFPINVGLLHSYFIRPIIIMKLLLLLL